MQYGEGSVSTTLNSTARMPPLTRKISPSQGTTKDLLQNNYTLKYLIKKNTNLSETTFADRPVCFQKVWLQVDFKQVASDSLNCVIYGKDVNPLSILDIRTRLNTERDIKLNTISSRTVETIRVSIHLMTSPSRTLRLLRTTLFMRTFSSEQVSSDSTMHTVSRLFFPFISTVSPRKSCSSSILV